MLLYYYFSFPASAHLLYKRPEDLHRTVDRVKAFFRREGIGCMTFQPEFLPVDEATTGGNDEGVADIMVAFNPSKCYSKCANKACDAFTCCSLEQQEDDNDEHKKLSRNLRQQEESCTVSPSASTTECSLSPDRSSLTSST